MVGLALLVASPQRAPATSGWAQPVILAQPVSHVHPGCPSSAPSGAVSPARPPGCSQRSPRTRGLLQLFSPFPSPIPAHPAPLFSHSASQDPAEHPVLAMPEPAPAHACRDSSQAAAWGRGLPVCTRHLPLAPETLQPCGFTPHPQHLRQPRCWRCCSSSASPCPSAPARCARAPVPSTALVPHHPHCHSSPPRCRGSGTAGSVQGSCHRTQCTRNMAEPGSLPPACGQPARPGKARDSLGLPAQESFPPAPAGHSPTGGSSPASSFQGWHGRAGVKAQLCIPWPQPKTLRSGIGDAWRGRGASLPCLARATARCSGGGCQASPPLPVLPASRQAGDPPVGVCGQGAGCLQPVRGANHWC